MPAHTPSVSLLAGISQLLATCRRAVSSVLWDVKALGTDTIWLSIHEVLYTTERWGGDFVFLCLNFLSIKWGYLIHLFIQQLCFEHLASGRDRSKYWRYNSDQGKKSPCSHGVAILVGGTSVVCLMAFRSLQEIK